MGQTESVLPFGTNIAISNAEITDVNSTAATLVSLETIANKISFSGAEAEEISNDSFASAKTGYKSYLQGLKDPGELSFDGYYDTQSNAHKAVADAYSDGKPRLIVITLPCGTAHKSIGFVKSHPFDVELSGVVTTSVSIRLSGEPVQEAV